MKKNRPIDDIVNIAKQFVDYFEEVEEQERVTKTYIDNINKDKFMETKPYIKTKEITNIK